MKKYLMSIVFLFFIGIFFIPCSHAMKQKGEKRVDVLILGEKGSGKTSLRNCLVGNANPNECGTMLDNPKISYAVNHANINGVPVAIVYWDTPSFDFEFWGYLVDHGVKCSFIVLAYDMEKYPEQCLIYKISDILCNFTEIHMPYGAYMIIAGTKEDLRLPAERIEIKDYVNKMIYDPLGGIDPYGEYIETSAMYNIGTMQIETIIKEILSRTKSVKINIDILPNYVGSKKLTLFPKKTQNIKDKCIIA